MYFTRLDRLIVECGEELPLGADYGQANVNAPMKAKLLLETKLSDDDRQYCEAIARGERDDDEVA